MELPAQAPPEMEAPEESDVDEAVEVLLKAEAIKRNPALFAAARAKMMEHKQSIDSLNPITDAQPGGAMAALKAVRAAKLASG